ncbi:MAG: hypothetical protein EOO85_03230 [Pedobacter sp.]|nr:MAG: hypothetical protein EOO85_03230 [Pedobacter sp.]
MFKNFLKTSWRIEGNLIKIYPSRTFYLLAPVIAILFAGLLFVYITYQNVSLIDALPWILAVILITIGFWGSAKTFIEFDTQKAVMRKMIFGILPSTVIPFAYIKGIDAVSHIGIGSYNYNVFLKKTQYGKGIPVSSGYTNNDDPNAIAFVNEVIPLIHSYLDLYDQPEDFVKEIIKDYKYFQQKDATYIIKNRKVGAVIFAIVFMVIGLWLFTIPTDSFIAMLMCALLFIFFGLVFLNAALTRYTIDIQNQIISRTGILKFTNKKYHLDDYAGIQTIRHTMNLIYVRTSINLHFVVPANRQKYEILTVASLFREKSINRFVQEFNQILDILQEAKR